MLLAHMQNIFAIHDDLGGAPHITMHSYGKKRQVNRVKKITNRYHHVLIAVSQTHQDKNFLHWKFSEILYYLQIRHYLIKYALI